MSPSSNSRLNIGLGAAGLALSVRSGRWVRWRAPAAMPGVVQLAIPAEQQLTEQGALAVLCAALQGEQERNAGAVRKQRASLVLDDFWANHAILRGDFRALRAHELEELTLAYFADRFGLDPAALLLRWRVLHGGRVLFASALARSLFDGIQAAATAAQVAIDSLRLGLPTVLDRVRRMVAMQPAMFLFVGEVQLQAVLAEQGCWNAYDSQRLFAGDGADPARIAELAVQMFERTGSMRRTECTVYLCGSALDPAPFEQRFAATVQLPLPGANEAPAARLLELAR